MTRLEQQKLLVLTNMLKELKRIADALESTDSKKEKEKDKETLLNFYDVNTK